MKWRDLGLTLGLLLILAPYLSAQTQPAGGMGSVSGGVGRFADGTVALPSIAFAADTDTGLYRPGANIVSVALGGTNAVWMSQTGNFLTLGAAGSLAWSSVSGDASVTADTGLARSGSATVTASNGSTGRGAFSTAGTALALALPAGSIGIATSATTTVGNVGQGARLVVVCGPTAGTASLLFYAGTTNVPVTLANAVGGGLIGC